MNDLTDLRFDLTPPTQEQRRELEAIREQLDAIGENYDAAGRPFKKGSRFGWA